MPLTALYLGAHATILYVVGKVLIGSQKQPWGWHEAASAFAFSLVIVLLVPVLPHLGSVEAFGLGVLLQFGVSRNGAVASFLAVCLLTTGTIILVCVLMLLLLHHEVGLVVRRLSHKRGRGQKENQQKPQEPEQQEQEAGI